MCSLDCGLICKFNPFDEIKVLKVKDMDLKNTYSVKSLHNGFIVLLATIPVFISNIENLHFSEQFSKGFIHILLF